MTETFMVTFENFGGFSTVSETIPSHFNKCYKIFFVSKNYTDE